MGKRKKSGKKVTVQKRVYKIPKFFECPLCGRKDGIKITIDHKCRKAQLQCRSCGAKEEGIEVTPLTEPIDIYDDYMDRARAANEEYNPQQIEDVSSSDNELNRGSDLDSDTDDDFRNGKLVKDKGSNNRSDTGSDLDSSSGSDDNDISDSD